MREVTVEDGKKGEKVSQRQDYVHTKLTSSRLMFSEERGNLGLRELNRTADDLFCRGEDKTSPFEGPLFSLSLPSTLRPFPLLRSLPLSLSSECPQFDLAAAE